LLNAVYILEGNSAGLPLFEITNNANHVLDYKLSTMEPI
jgi:hypothetical protein